MRFRNRFALVAIVAAGLALQSSCSTQGSPFAPMARLAPERAKYAAATRPAYLAVRDRIDSPVATSAETYIRGLLSTDLLSGEEPTQVLVDEFERQCLARSLARDDPAPNIDVSVLDPIIDPLPDGRIPVAPGHWFCVDDDASTASAAFSEVSATASLTSERYATVVDEASAMARRLAQMPAMLDINNAYVPRVPLWCGGAARGVPGVSRSIPAAITVSGLNSPGPSADRAGLHCWAGGKKASYDDALTRLERVLATSGRAFRRDRLVKDGSLLHQAAFIYEDGSAAHTVLILGRKSKMLNGPDVEIHALLGRFVQRTAFSSPPLASEQSR